MSRLLRAEALKLWTTKMWWGLLLGALAVTAISVLATALTAGSTGAPAVPGLDKPVTVRTVYGAGAGSAYIFALNLGIIGMSGEFRHMTITSTFLVTPRRSPVVVAKLVTYSIMGLVYGLVATVFAVLLGGAVIAAKGFDLRLTSDGVPQTLALATLAVAVWAVFGLGLGTLIKNQVAAILTAVGVSFIVEPLLSFLLNRVHLGGVAKFLPQSAATAITRGVDTGQAVLPWWGGALVLVGYGVGFAALGLALTLRRDIA